FHNFICSYCGRVLSTEEHHFDKDHNCTRCGEGAVCNVVMYVTKDHDGKAVYSYDDCYLNEDYRIRSCSTSPEGKEFIGWHFNTAPDDPGHMYLPGETIPIVTSKVYGFEAVYCKKEDTSYIDKNGHPQNVEAWVIDGETKGLTEGWYVTGPDTVIANLCFRGSVNIIAADDTGLTVSASGVIDACDTSSGITLYGQENNSGRITAGGFGGYKYEQYGGEAVYDSFRVLGFTRIKGGRFTCTTLDQDSSLYIEGGNTDIISVNYGTSQPVYVGWTGLNDSIHIGNISSDCTICIKPGQSLTDGTIFLSGNVTGADVTGKYLVPYDGCGALLAGHRVTLEGDIGLWFYMIIDQQVLSHEDALIRFTVPDGDSTYTTDIKVADAPTEKIGGITYRKFRCNVSAKDMASPIKAQLIDGSTSGQIHSYSVSDYARYLLEHTDGNEQYRKASELVRALINYGAYAQKYFGIAPDTPANAGYEYTEDEMDNVSFADPGYEVTGLPAGVTFEGASLSLKYETTLSLYFKYEGEGMLSFSCPGREDPKAEIIGDYQVARIRDIRSDEIGSTLTVIVNGQGEVSYSPLTYCAKVLDTMTDEDLCNVCKTLVLFYQAAINYHP
ncbi:MAG: hypothetical protein IKH76_11060, partial [Clostridiales bacterium]|nr:hypothetical protein [Clostridiales bacterium]